MASDLNQCNFIGRLGADPEVRHTASGKAVANLNLAVGWKGKNGEGVEWVRVVLFDRTAEVAGEYLNKGSRVFVSGRMQTKKWTDRDGNDRYTTEVIANQLQMLDGRRDDQGGQREQQPDTRRDTPPHDDLEGQIPF